MESLSIKGKYHFLRQKDDNLPFDKCTYFSDICSTTVMKQKVNTVHLP